MPAAGPRLAFHRHAFNASTSGAACATLHAVARAPRGDGSEGVVLALPLDTRDAAAAAFAAAVGAATAVHLRQSGWLAKDAVLLFVDAACGAGSLEGTQVRGRRARACIRLSVHCMRVGCLPYCRPLPYRLVCPPTSPLVCPAGMDVHLQQRPPPV